MISEGHPVSIFLFEGEKQTDTRLQSEKELLNTFSPKTFPFPSFFCMHRLRLSFHSLETLESNKNTLL